MAKTLGRPATDAGNMSLLEHLTELRSRLIKCLIAVAVGAVVGFVLFDAVVDLLSGPLEDLSGYDADKPFISLDPLEIFLFRIKMSGYLGIAIVMPFLLWQLWQFIAPGLYQNERRYAAAFVASASFLFAVGAAVAFFTLAPALDFLQSMGGDDIAYQYTLPNYVMLVVYMMLAFGVGFQFPIVLIFLQIVGVLKPQQLRDFRRFGVVIIFVVAAVITPSADPISLLALALPMCIFYEISIIVGRLLVRRRARAEANG